MDDQGQMGLFDHDESIRQRDEALDQVEENAAPWFDQGIAQVAMLAATRRADERFRGEQIRYWVREEIGEPHHPNAWGALINAAVRRKIIVDTGEEQQMSKPSSHARRTAVYRWGEP